MNALISVSDKTNIVDFASKLSSLGINLISTGGTLELLTANGINVSNILDITTYSKPVDSIIKTLYPEIYAGISANRNDPVQMNQLQSSDIVPIDIVVVNLYPLDTSLSKNILSIDSYLDCIDIGGPTMLRSAAKSYKDIIVICDPSDYPLIIQELETNSTISTDTRLYLMKKVFKTTFEYESRINQFIENNL